METDVPSCGTGFIGLRNGVYDVAERCVSGDEKGFFIGRKSLFHRLEEPFPEHNLQSVRGIPVTVAGDESAHSQEDAVRLIEEYGFGAIALKPIAKTVSVTLGVLEEAGNLGVPCFCADLTVNPRMVEINKCFAARLGALKGLKIGVFESNGSQNYRNWQQMMAASDLDRMPWANMKNGSFELDDAYYHCDGNIWKD